MQMSKVNYRVGKKMYSFSTDLQISNLLAVETCLIEEIKNNMRKNDVQGVMQDITLMDDNGLIASAKDFKNNYVSLKIKNIEQ